MNNFDQNQVALKKQTDISFNVGISSENNITNKLILPNAQTGKPIFPSIHNNKDRKDNQGPKDIEHMTLSSQDKLD